MHLQRRNAIKLALSSLVLIAFNGCASSLSKKDNSPIVVDGSNIKDINGLIAAIKKSAGSRLPTTITTEEFYRSIAATFLENARRAKEIGMEVPKWIVEKLPKKIASNGNPVKPEFVAIMIVGLMILVPWAVFFSIVLASIITLTKYITDKLNQSNT